MLRSILFTILISSSLVAAQTCVNSCAKYNIEIKSDPTLDQSIGTCSTVLTPSVAVPILGTALKPYSLSSAVYITDCISTDVNIYRKASTRYFTRTFTLDCPPHVAYLSCKVNGNAELYVNGMKSSFICKNSISSAGISMDDSAIVLNFQEGLNVIEWRVDNIPMANSNAASNPDALIYHLNIVRG